MTMMTSLAFSTYVIGIFLFSTLTRTLFFDHQRYEAHLYDGFQVQETISGFNTCAWASNFDIANAQVTAGVSHCECSASPIASLNIDLLISYRPLIILTLPRFPLGRSVIFLLKFLRHILYKSTSNLGCNFILQICAFHHHISIFKDFVPTAERSYETSRQ